MNEKFDIFICYDHNDRTHAERLFNSLSETGTKVWFDRRQSKIGMPVSDAVSQGIHNSNMVLVLIGNQDVTRWMRREISIALENEPGKPVVPLLLPGVDESRVDSLPSYLRFYPALNCDDRVFTGVIEPILTSLSSSDPPEGSESSQRFTLRLTGPHGERPIEMFTLPNPNPTRLLNLSWATFGEGIKTLSDQLLNYGHEIHVDLSIGINDAGMVMSTFLNSARLGRGRLGYIRTRNNPRDWIEKDASILPDLRDRPVLLLADFEIKTSSVLRRSVDFLRDRYRDPEFYFVIFGALVVAETELEIKSVDDLAACDELESLGLDRLFIASTMRRPGIEPPLGLR